MRHERIPICMKNCRRGDGGKIYEQRQVKHDKFGTHKSAWLLLKRKKAADEDPGKV